MTTVKQITETIEEAIAKHQIDREWYDRDDAVESFDYYGLRFESAARQVGDICNNSKDNTERQDEREFPVYGTPEYNELPELDGASAWNINPDSKLYLRSYANDYFGNCKPYSDKEYSYMEHAYIIAGNGMGYHPNPDDNEVLIRNAKVIAVIF